MFQPLKWIFEHCIEEGHLEVICSNNKRYTFGDGTGTPVRVRFTDRKLERQLAFVPQIALGEAYMKKRFLIENGTMFDFLALIIKGAAVDRQLPWWAEAMDNIRLLFKRIQQYNPVSRSRKNVSHHYDIKSEIYDLFLDRNRQYSCAYFEDGQDDLDLAQLAKKQHLACKLHAKPGQRVLDIGSGWGGLSLYLARNYDVNVTGITLSSEQLKYAQQKAQDHNLLNTVEYQMRDYRHLEGKFDRIISVGMFEHVGINHYKAYFKKIYDLLPDDGVAVIHTIGRCAPPGVTDPFIAKYIFPGGYIPSLSEVLPAIEKSGLVLTDLEVLRFHYAETLQKWRERFLARWDDAANIMDEEFCRMWEYYLAASETGFRFHRLVNFQFQLTKRMVTLPVTRDYMQNEESRLRKNDTLEPDRRETG